MPVLAAEPENGLGHPLKELWSTSHRSLSTTLIALSVANGIRRQTHRTLESSLGIHQTGVAHPPVPLWNLPQCLNA